MHCKRDKFDVYIGRPSKWGNPYSHKNGTLALYRVASVEEAIEKYEVYVRNSPELMHSLNELKGKVLGCWCAPGPCHGDVLAQLAEESQ